MFCKKELNIQTLPSIRLVADETFVDQNRSFGCYYPEEKVIKVYYKDRVMADYLRSLAHELVHHRQRELDMLELESGSTGSNIENEANAMAAIIMREYAHLDSSIFTN